MRYAILALVVLSVGAGKPATRPAALVDQVAQLKKEVEALRAEVAALREELESAHDATIPRPSKEIADAIAKGKIVVGMSESQVEKIIHDADLHLSSRTSEREFQGRVQKFRVWETGGTYEGYREIVARDGRVISVEK